MDKQNKRLIQVALSVMESVQSPLKSCSPAASRQHLWMLFTCVHIVDRSLSALLFLPFAFLLLFFCVVNSFAPSRQHLSFLLGSWYGGRQNGLPFFEFGETLPDLSPCEFFSGGIQDAHPWSCAVYVHKILPRDPAILPGNFDFHRLIL